MIVRVLLQMLQIAGFHVLEQTFHNSVTFLTADAVKWFVAGVRGVFGRLFGMFSGRNAEAQAA